MVRRSVCRVSFVVAVLLTASLIGSCSQMRGNSTRKCEIGAAAGMSDEMTKKNNIRLEHVALNVEDPVKMADWYCRNLGMKVVRQGPPPANARFVSDAGGNMMLELYRNPPDAVPDYASMDPLLLHVAFMVDDVARIREKLIAAGATPVGEVSITPSGDEIAMLRDPWGLAIQFVKRAEPMLD